MNPHLPRCAIAALLAAVAWITGCGPSTGGTGTGASVVGLQAYGAKPIDLCASPVASAADCVAANPGAVRPVVYFASAAGDVVATIDANDVRIDSPCRALVFEGTWARTQTLGDRFYGALLAPAIDLPPASAAMLPSGNGSSVDVTLRDSAETVLLGPVTLLRVASLPVPAPSCTR